jgi:hypothetical protein
LLDNMQVPHVHPLVACGFMPAAAQLKPVVGAVAGEGAEGGAAFAAPGRGSSQAAHCVASVLLGTIQVPHVHPLAALGFIPAAAQSKPAAAGVGAALAAPGFGSSQEMHCGASCLLETMQVLHVHPLDACGFRPAAAQLKTAGAA